MVVLKNRILWLFVAGAALAYASQHYTIGGWQHLRIVPKGAELAESSPSTDLQDPRAWEPSAWLSGWTDRETSPADGGEAVGSSSMARPASPATSWEAGPGSFTTTTSARSASARRVQASPSHPSGVTAAPVAEVVRIATFNLQAFGETKASKEAVMEILARLLRSFDVVALQDITSRQRDTLPRLVDRINRSDRRFDYCIGPRVGPGLRSMHFAFVFDTERIEIDRHQLYTVEDPSDQLEYEPLVGWFRSRRVQASEAFAFTLVNLRISPERVDRELPLLPNLIRTIHGDGRQEDDILLAGDFGCSDARMERLKTMGVTFALEGVPTTIVGEEMLDNILFPRRNTHEFLGRSGAMDFLRQFNLTPDQASQVSSHMPVWCEFSVREGGEPGYVP
jgi:endonuclease/exonuclease/phosphatase family metal-dependent hydrolase